MFIITSDWTEIDEELDRVESLPGPKGMALLDAAHEKNFVIATAEVDVLSGDLKASGTSTTSVHGPHDWEGTMHWGGQDHGGPVDYAIYEKARGGGHDWIESTRSAMHANMVSAMKEVLSR